MRRLSAVSCFPYSHQSFPARLRLRHCLLKAAVTHHACLSEATRRMNVDMRCVAINRMHQASRSSAVAGERCAMSHWHCDQEERGKRFSFGKCGVSRSSSSRSHVKTRVSRHRGGCSCEALHKFCFHHSTLSGRHLPPEWLSDHGCDAACV
jgi:hypothetical protein